LSKKDIEKLEFKNLGSGEKKAKALQEQIEINKIQEAIVENNEKIRTQQKKKKNLKSEKSKEESEGTAKTLHSKYIGKDGSGAGVNVNQVVSNRKDKTAKNPQSARVASHRNEFDMKKVSSGSIYNNPNEKSKINMVVHNSKDIGRGMHTKKMREIEDKLFFDKNRLENLVETQKTGNPVTQTHKNFTKNLVQESIKQNFASNFAHKNSQPNTGKVVKVYSARPDWVGGSPYQNLHHQKSPDLVQSPPPMAH
jgi:hypothetical protein